MRKSVAPRVLTTLLLTGMGLMIPCYLFTVGNVALSSWPLYDRNRAALVLLTALCTVGLLLAFRQSGRHETFFTRHRRGLLLLAALFYLAAQLLLAQFLRFTPKTDAEQCFTAAQLLADTGTFSSSERALTYFSRCPHNLGLVYLLAAVFRFFGLFGWTDRFMQAICVASLLFTPGLLAGAGIARHAGGIKAQMRYLILCASCLPLLYCTSELYTDGFSIAFPTMIVYSALRLQAADSRRGRALWALVFALCTFVGAQIRFTAVIAAIACLIVLLFSHHVRRALLAMLMLVAILLPGNSLMDAQTARHIDPDVIAAQRLPILHYIAMGLPIHEDQGYGQYGDGGWYIFSTSFDNPDERNGALLREIIDRVYYLRYPNRLLNLLSRKNLSTFGDGTFMLQEIFEADAYTPDNAVKQVLFNEGALHPLYMHLCTSLFLAQMLLACLACAQAIRRRDVRGAGVFIALVGIFLFLCAWETRARYFFQFELMLLCAAALCAPDKISLRRFAHNR